MKAKLRWWLARRGARAEASLSNWSGGSNGVLHWSKYAWRPSEINRPETIEETAEVTKAGEKSGGKGFAVQVDHLDPEQVQALVARIEREEGRLDVLVNDIWGGDWLAEWNVPVWEHSLEAGLHMLRLAIDTHIITSHFALPLDQKAGRIGR